MWRLRFNELVRLRDFCGKAEIIGTIHRDVTRMCGVQ